MKTDEEGPQRGEDRNRTVNDLGAVIKRGFTQPRARKKIHSVAIDITLVYTDSGLPFLIRTVWDIPRFSEIQCRLLIPQACFHE